MNPFTIFIIVLCATLICVLIICTVIKICGDKNDNKMITSSYAAEIAQYRKIVAELELEKDKIYLEQSKIQLEILKLKNEK